ncbi:tRNA-specific 2-thiouridylase [Candidatus Giovannonibacteria bacterium]|nr:tRNA-specific 2-thiouridylase [Candidatus Giovannonibacteria bacterium]
MSGGVDSSVAALLMKEEGYDVTGAHMLCWDGCEDNADKRDAMRVCAKIGIPFKVFDFKKEYREKVFDYMVREYKSGRTPNPDVMCNSEIKFGIFLKNALEAGADYIATGHYVRRRPHLLSQTDNSSAPVAADYLHSRPENFRFAKDQAFRGCESFSKANETVALISAMDTAKDQSYFLWTLTQNQLKRALFPIGEYLKSEVRLMAKKAGLSTAGKKDSQGLCFVGKVDFGEFLRQSLPQLKGDIMDSSGKKLGEHDGAHFFTLGQRHGLNIGGSAQPLYIAERNVAANTLVVARGDADPILYRKELVAENINWISGVPEFPLTCRARIRYRQLLQKCELAQNGEVIFEIPQRAVAPGQSIVFYSDFAEMLGGGIIKE